MTGLVEDDIDAAFDALPRRASKALIGASAVGDPCEASLAFSLRGYPDSAISPQLRRIFRDGDRIEALVVADMRRAGYHIMEVDPFTGEQWSFREYGNHLRCRTDGFVEDKTTKDLMLLEIKSMNDARHKAFASKGLKTSNPKYYAQVQLMMGLSKTNTSLFVAYNKNNSTYKSEVVQFDPFFYASLLAKVERVMRNEAEKIATDESDWRCKSCFKLDACWRGKAPEVSCVTCAFSFAHTDGWWCEKRSAVTTEACTEYLPYHPKPRA